jgi:hypothetical protein
MGYRYASDNKALALCDICGFQYKLRELRSTIKKGKITDIKACPECWNPDHPQLHLGEIPVEDPQALRDPRPDSAELVSSRDFQWGWSPVGFNNNDGLTPDNLEATGGLGTVTVTTS